MIAGRADHTGLPGRIIVLNGAPRSGKSTLAKAIQTDLDGNWLNIGVDAQAATMPQGLMPGIGLRPGGERPDLEPIVAALYPALFQSIASYAHAGFDIVADLGMHEDYSRPLDVFGAAARILGPLGALVVGVDCGIDEIMRRRNADPRGGFYVGGDTPPAPVLRWQTAVHENKTYDLRLDMGVLMPEEGVGRVAELLVSPPEVPALKLALTAAERG